MSILIPETDLPQELTAEQAGFLEESDLLRLELRSDNAHEAEVLVNATLDAYLKKVVEEEEKERTDKLREMKKIYDTASKTLQTKGPPTGPR